jgi:hypothetical protein
MSKKASISSISQIVVTGEGRDEWGNRYIKLAVKGATINLPPFRLDQIGDDPKDLYSRLNNAGMAVLTPAAKNQLLNMLQDYKPTEPSFTVATRLGWNGRVIVRPDQVIGKPKVPVELALSGLDIHMLAKYRVRGTLQDWQTNVAEVCTGNTRLMFAVSLAFTGPILRLVSGPRGGGFQFNGPRETGKTTAGMLSGSVWGCRRDAGNSEIGFSETWNSTDNKIEVTALAHNDCLLILDETTLAGGNDQKRAQVVTNVVMTLSQQNEKQRLTNVTAARWWRCYFLSTSNHTLDEIAGQGRVYLDDAHRSRLTEIPLPTGGFGIYEDLHGFASGEELTNELIIRARKFFGSAGLEFQQKLVADCRADKQELRKWLAGKRKDYSKRLKARAKRESMKPLNRSTGRCATVYAAGCLAIRYGIVPWKKAQLLRAVLDCQLDGLRHVVESPKKADSTFAGLRSKVLAYLRDHRREFINLDKTKLQPDAHKFGSVPGYRAKFKGKKWLYVTAEQLSKIIGDGDGDDADQVKKELVQSGILCRGNNGRYVVQRPIFSGQKGNKGYRRVHAFRLGKVSAEV